MSGNNEGILLISVDGLLDGSPTHTAYRRSVMTAHALADLLGELDLPASWAFADPASSKVPRALLRQEVEHRIGLLAERHWAGADCGRTLYARELTRRLSAAAESGLAIDSLALREGTAAAHLDMLVRNRLGIVRERYPGRRKSFSGICLSSHRYGIWRCAPSCRFPLAGRWWERWFDSPARRISRQAGYGDLAHLVIDGPALGSPRTRAWRRLRTLLLLLHRHVASGQMRCMPLERLVERIRQDRSCRPLTPAARRTGALSRRAA